MRKILKTETGKLFLIIFFLCLIVMTYSLLQDNSSFQLIYKYFTDSSMRSRYTFSKILGVDGWELNYIMGRLTILYQLFLPALVSIAGILFYKNSHTVHKLQIYRDKKYRSFLLKQILKNSFTIAIATYLSYFVFSIFIYFCSNGAVNPSGIYAFLADIVGDKFQLEHMFIYMSMQGLFKVFLIPFAYAMFSCSMALLMKSEKQVFFTSNFYYYGLSIIGFSLSEVFAYSEYINPSTALAFGDMQTMHTIIFILINMIPLYIAIFIIFWKSRYVEI